MIILVFCQDTSLWSDEPLLASFLAPKEEQTFKTSIHINEKLKSTFKRQQLWLLCLEKLKEKKKYRYIMIFKTLIHIKLTIQWKEIIHIVEIFQFHDWFYFTRITLTESKLSNKKTTSNLDKSKQNNNCSYHGIIIKRKLQEKTQMGK